MVQSRFAETRFAETRFAETLTLTLTLNPNFGETVSANREDTDFAAAKAAIAATYGKTQDHGRAIEVIQGYRQDSGTIR